MISHQGRPNDGTDATGFFNVEILAPLKPIDQWRKGLDKETLIRRPRGAARMREFPGIEFNFSQYIEDNVQEAASGVKGENSVKIFGNDLAQLTKTANAVKAAAGHACPASPTCRCSIPSASRPCGSTSTATRPPATACRSAT